MGDRREDRRLLRQVRLEDVSRRAGVSTATTSRVLTGKGRVSEALRHRVLAAVDALGYTPDRIARSMTLGRTMTIGLVVSDVTNPFFTSVARGVEDAAREGGYGILLCNTDEDPEIEKTQLNILRERRVDGILLAPAGGESSHIQSLVDGGSTMVLIDRHIKGVDAPSVQVENAGATAEATRYLLSLGHRDIAIVVGKPSVSTSEERLQGYVQAHHDALLSPRPDLVFGGRYAQEGGYDSGAAIARMEPRPSAVISCNNVMTTGLLLALRDAGVRIPEDISLISFDDLPYFTLLDHPLTAIQQPMYELGHVACNLLLDILRSS